MTNLILVSSSLTFGSSNCSLVISNIFLTALSKMDSGYFLSLSFCIMDLASDTKCSSSVQILLALTNSPYGIEFFCYNGWQDE